LIAVNGDFALRCVRFWKVLGSFLGPGRPTRSITPMLPEGKPHAEHHLGGASLRQ